jgi:predicted Zn-dependent protease
VFQFLARVGRWPLRHPKTCALLALVLALGGLAAGAGVLYWRAGQFPAAEQALSAGRFDEARHHLRRCLSWSPDDPDVLCLAARLERVEGHYEEAAAYLDECVRRHGAGRLSSLEATLLRTQQGDLSEERVLLGLVHAADPQSPWILEALARANLEALRFRQASVCLQLWLKEQPDCARALELHGNTLEHMAAIPPATKAYERALQLDPERWRVRLRLASILVERKRLDEAAPHLDQLERDHPDDADVCVLLGRRDVLQYQPGRAREHFRAALRTDPKHFRALFQLGKLELQQDHLQEAEGWLARANQAAPFDTHTHLALAECYTLLGDTTGKAEQHRRRHDEIKNHSRKIDEILVKRLPAAPKNPELLTELAGHFFGVGQDRLGLQFLNQALEVDRTCRPAHAALAAYYERVGAPEKAAPHHALAK